MTEDEEKDAIANENGSRKREKKMWLEDDVENAKERLVDNSHVLEEKQYEPGKCSIIF